MSKIICDVCGTAYPDTATQCPICGCAKPADAAAYESSAMNSEEAASGYTYVKGGRFSKSNVRKRNKANNQSQPVKPPKSVRAHEEEPDDEQEERGTQSNKGLVAVVLILLLAIVGVVIYIAVRFFLPAYGGFDFFGGKDETTAAVVETTTEAATTSDGLIHCTDLIVTDTTISFDGIGQAWKLNVQPQPADTDDEITYVSSNEAVATVSADGIVTAVESGESTITITCGDQVVQCQVICVIETTEATTVPETTVPETTVPETTAPVAKTYKLCVNGTARKTYDVTVPVGGSFTLTLVDQDGNVADVTWKNSGPSYVSVVGNTIKGKAPTSYVKISTELDGKTYECIVRVSG